jgi:hypothetical protein
VSSEFETSSDIDSGDLILTQQLSTPDTAAAENEYVDTSDSSVPYLSKECHSDPGTPVKKDPSSRSIRRRRSDNVSY